MKCLSKYMLFVIMILLSFNSCIKRAFEQDCATRQLGDVYIKSLHPLADSIVLIYICVKGSNCTDKIDSQYQKIGIVPDSTWVPGFPCGTFYINFDTSKDYLITLLPSGKTHRITDIRYGSEKSTRTCYCSYGYNVDGKNVFHPVYEWDGKTLDRHSSASPIEIRD
jgi:hypothetical protein